MLPTQRRQAILAQVREQAAVSAEQLARQFGVSVETIRRDLRRLHACGLAVTGSARPRRAGLLYHSAGRADHGLGTSRGAPRSRPT
jgi:predicted DNA-binding transcriptional regulator YafY